MDTQTLPRMNTEISFNNTEVAFAHRTNEDLKQAHWLYSLMGKPWIVKMGTKLAPWAINVGLPVKGLIRKTIFKQFVGGESLNETIPVAKKNGSIQCADHFGLWC